MALSNMKYWKNSLKYSHYSNETHENLFSKRYKYLSLVRQSKLSYTSPKISNSFKIYLTFIHKKVKQNLNKKF